MKGIFTGVVCTVLYIASVKRAREKGYKDGLKDGYKLNDFINNIEKGLKK